MPRTCAYLRPFESLFNRAPEGTSRRSVMAAGVAAALAAPMSTRTAASVSAEIGEDWPEFFGWVELVKKSDAQWKHLHDHHDTLAGDEIGRREIYRLEEAVGNLDRQIYRAAREIMEKREIRTERHQAMAVAILIRSHSRNCIEAFNPTAIDDGHKEPPAEELALRALLTVLVRHYISNHVLDEVPWSLATGA